LKRGQSIQIKNGAYAGDMTSIDHRIPIDHDGQLENNLLNLRIHPLRDNVARRAAIDDETIRAVDQFEQIGWKPSDELKLSLFAAKESPVLSQ